MPIGISLLNFLICFMKLKFLSVFTPDFNALVPAVCIVGPSAIGSEKTLG